MKYKYLFLIIGISFIFLSLNFVSALTTFCYQETANLTNGADGSCGLNYTGRYYVVGSNYWVNIASLYDGNWSTYTYASGGTNLYINYSKPSSTVFNGTVWQIKWGNMSINSTVYTQTVNLTLTSACLSRNPVSVLIQPVVNGYSFLCFNGSVYSNLGSGLGGSVTNIYEEAMIWNVTSSSVFYNISDNNGTLTNTGTGNFYVNVNNTNGTVYLNINGQSILATNLTSNFYNVSYNFSYGAVYNYNWSAYNSNNFLAYSNNTNYTVLNTRVFCYQESANVSNQTGIDGSCGQTYTGVYLLTGSSFTNPSNLYDGNWSSFATSPKTLANYYVNYSNPSKSFYYGTVLQVKGTSTNNYTLDASCLNNPIQILINGSSNSFTVYCKGTNWINLGSLALTSAQFYEEAIIWNVDGVTNCWTKTGTGRGSILFIPKGCLYFNPRGVLK